MKKKIALFMLVLVMACTTSCINMNGTDINITFPNFSKNSSNSSLNGVHSSLHSENSSSNGVHSSSNWGDSSWNNDSSSLNSSNNSSSWGDSSSSNSSSNWADSSSSNSSSNWEDGDCVEHVDSDSNGVCEECGESTLRTFDFFAINDLHGKFTDTDTQIGVDEMTTYLKQAKENNENTIFLSSGDMWQGGSESNLTQGMIITDWMNNLGFSSMTLGNHEYDWGEEFIIENRNFANFPFLAINIYDSDTDERVEYCDASVMIERNGAKIGIIGAMGDCYSSIAQDKVGGVYFKTGSQLTSLVKAEATKLKEQGADCIVYSIHDEGEYDVSLSNGYVDIVFEGHTHQAYTTTDSYGVYHLQNGGDNTKGISKASLKINIANETSDVTQAKIVYASEYQNLEDDPLIAQLLAKYKSQIEVGTKVLGINDKIRNSDELSYLAAQLYLETGRQKWGNKYDIVLGGGSINVRSPYNLNAGEVTYGDLQMLFPFDNQLVLCSIQGRYLKSRFINNSQYYVAYDASIVSSIKDNQTYYIVTDTWNAPYASNRLTEIERYDETTFARDLLAKYVSEGGLTKGETKIEINLTSIPKILEVGNALANNAETSMEYDVKGKVISVVNTTYGNLTIEDENGNTLYIYGVYDKYGKANGGKRYDAMTNPPKVGDTVVLRGVIKKYVYNGTVTIEIFNSKLLLMNEEIENV